MKLASLIATIACCWASLSWAQCSGINMGGQCLPPPNVPGSPLYQGGYDAPTPVAPPQPQTRDRFGAFAIDNNFNVSWVTNYLNEYGAQLGADGMCKYYKGEGCRPLGQFWNTCGVYAINLERKIFGGFNPKPKQAAREAMEACNKNSPSGLCQLLSWPVCAGLHYRSEAEYDANHATRADIEALAAKYDDREYWGATATDNFSLWNRYDYRDRNSAESAAFANCAKDPDCRIAATVQDSCVGGAMPKDKRPGVEIVINPNPNVARQQALTQCNARFGANACKASVNCTGRRYLFEHLDANAPN